METLENSPELHKKRGFTESTAACEFRKFKEKYQTALNSIAETSAVAGLGKPEPQEEDSQGYHP